MSVECVAELRKFYDSQEVIEEEERLRKQNLEEATESTRQQKHKISELSSDTIPDEIEEVIMEEDSVGMKLTQTLYDTHQMHFRPYLVLLYTHVSSLRSLFIWLAIGSSQAEDIVDEVDAGHDDDYDETFDADEIEEDIDIKDTSSIPVSIGSYCVIYSVCVNI